MYFKNKKLLPLSGITLTELLIASIIVGIVMLGAVSVDYAIRRSQKNVADASHIAMNLQAAMLQMTRDALQTTGDKTYPGVTWDDVGTEPADIQNICFRYADGNPNIYTDDKWFCYSQGGRDENNEIFRCTDRNDTAVGIATPLSANEACTDTVSRRGTHMFVARSKGFFVININGTGDIEYIEFNLETCADPASPQDPITNPCYYLTTRISPPGLSR